MTETPTPDDDSTIRTGDYFQQEYHVSAAEAGEFLIAVGECLQAGDDVSLSGDDWDLEFAYRDAVELEVEHVGGSDPELEIELELSAADDDGSPPTLG
jgi:amphi-Trp domain-containing protein